MAVVSEIDERLIGRLRQRGLRVTPQRIVIHRALCSESQHMTADQVLGRVSDVLPGTSLPTVYSTLELLEGLGLVRRVGVGNGAVVFDSRVEPHAHTVCRQCGVVADLDGVLAPSEALPRAAATGFVPDDAQLAVWGLCADCAASAATLN